MPPTPAPDPAAFSEPSRNLTGKKVGWWFVVAYAGQRDGAPHWRCMHRQWPVQKVAAESEILRWKVEGLAGHWGIPNARDSLVGYVYGQWEVIAPVLQPQVAPRRAGRRLWECRCACGAMRQLSADDLMSSGKPACGCATEEEVRAEVKRAWEQARKGFGKALSAATRQRAERERDRWTPEMDQALRTCQPECVICGEKQDLTKHHVWPLSRGYGLKPGNAVRLCRACNSFIHDRNPTELAPDTSHKLTTAARRFEEFWHNPRTAQEPADPAAALRTAATAAAGGMPTAPDARLLALLRAIERGDEGATSALADWLEERGDPRAQKVRSVPELVKSRVVREVGWKLGPHAAGGSETPPGPEEVDRLVGRALAGGDDFPQVTRPPPDGPKEPFGQYVRELHRRLQSEEVWQELGLSYSLRRTLKSSLGITATGEADTVEQLAEMHTVRVQTVRNRITQAVYQLMVPPAAERYEP